MQFATTIKQGMAWKNWVPGLGEHSVRKRIKKIKNLELSLPVFLATSITKTYESFVAANDQLLNWLTATALISLTYIYWDEITKIEKEIEKEAEKLG